MVVSLCLSEHETKILSRYAEIHNISITDVLRSSALEKIEDEMDQIAYDKAYAEYLQNPVTYTLDDVERIIVHRRNVYD